MIELQRVELQGARAAGCCFHVLQQRDNRQPLFGELVDYVRYLDYLQDALLRYGVFCHAYVLLSDQVQLLLSCDCREGVVRVMAAVADRHCWSNEFDATLRHFVHRIRNDRHLHAARHYIECKPVRSGLVPHPQAYYWSSYAHRALAVSVSTNS